MTVKIALKMSPTMKGSRRRRAILDCCICMGNRGFFSYLRINFSLTSVSKRPETELLLRWLPRHAVVARNMPTRRQSRLYPDVAGRRWRWKWHAQDPDEIDEDTPFYEDVIAGFHGAYAVNHPVQGSSAEVMQIALTRLDQALVTNLSRSSQRCTTKRCCWCRTMLNPWNASAPLPSGK